MASIRDVARIAGVSVGSVSRVFNGHPKIGAELEQRVMAAAEEIGYRHPRQSNNGGTIKQSRLKRIGLITLGMDRSLISLPVIATLLQGVNQRAEEYGLSVTLCDVPDPNDIPNVLEDRTVDAVLVKSALEGTASQWRAAAIDAIQKIPHVWLTGRPNGCVGDVCKSDNFEVGRLAADHLIERGHRTVAFLNPKPGHTVFHERQASFTWHAEQAGVNVITCIGKERALHFPIIPTSQANEVDVLLDEMLSSNTPPTAVFVPVDSVAVLLYRVMASRGIRIGEDISIISCNNEELFCSGLYPSLTTIDIRAEETGEYGVDHLVWRAENPEACPDMSISLLPRLVVRDSVREVKK